MAPTTSSGGPGRDSSDMDEHGGMKEFAQTTIRQVVLNLDGIWSNKAEAIKTKMEEAYGYVVLCVFVYVGGVCECASVLYVICRCWQYAMRVLWPYGGSRPTSQSLLTRACIPAFLPFTSGPHGIAFAAKISTRT